ncbi:hypothetical protein GIB67_022139 [Kingdonia uniflora]|uniref:Uncharacterized protein n=1 Tax=Kingdonia uniflora TaxID=39325 RepID=A0A7J7N976_9MAGN|nr:hypothetical protein GIB67_022139 [Kingdonia uniflora]
MDIQEPTRSVYTRDSNITGDVQLHKPPGSAVYLTEPCCLTASKMTEGNTALIASSQGKKAYE